MWLILFYARHFLWRFLIVSTRNLFCIFTFFLVIFFSCGNSAYIISLTALSLAACYFIWISVVRLSSRVALALSIQQGPAFLWEAQCFFRPHLQPIFFTIFPIVTLAVVCLSFSFLVFLYFCTGRFISLFTHWSLFLYFSFCFFLCLSAIFRMLYFFYFFAVSLSLFMIVSCLMNT